MEMRGGGGGGEPERRRGEKRGRGSQDGNTVIVLSEEKTERADQL
jgi:hypothetical protein